MRDLLQAPDRPYIFHLGAQAHVGESWHRPYETVMANTVGTLNLLQSIVDHGLELEKFDTAGTSEEYGNVRESVAAPPRLRRARRPDPARALADQPEVDLRDLEGRRRLPDDELPRRLRPPGRRHADVQQLRARARTRATSPARSSRRRSTRDVVELGQLEPLRDFCFCTDGVRGHLTVAAHGIPGDVYVYGQGENISMARLGRADPRASARSSATGRRARDRLDAERASGPGASEVMALRVGYEKLDARDGLGAARLAGRRASRRTIRWYAANRERWIGRVDWLEPDGSPSTRDEGARSRAAAGFLGSHLVERLRADGRRGRSSPRRARLRPDAWPTTPSGSSRDARPELVLPPRRRGRRHRRQPRQPGPLLVREPDDGRARARADAACTASAKLVVAGTICAYPKFAPVPFREDDLWNGYPEETNAPYGVAKKRSSSARRPTASSTGSNAIFLLPVNLYGPRDNFDLETSHVIPALIRKMLDARARRARGRALGRRLADARVPLRRRLRRGASCSRPSATTGPSRSTSARAARSRSASSRSSIAELTGFEGEIVWDASKPNGQPRRRLDVSRAEELLGFTAHTPLRDGLAQTIAWYRATAAIETKSLRT